MRDPKKPNLFQRGGYPLPSQTKSLQLARIPPAHPIYLIYLVDFVLSTVNVVYNDTKL